MLGLTAKHCLLSNPNSARSSGLVNAASSHTFNVASSNSPFSTFETSAAAAKIFRRNSSPRDFFATVVRVRASLRVCNVFNYLNFASSV
jgi:hypothetical protein